MSPTDASARVPHVSIDVHYRRLQLRRQWRVSLLFGLQVSRLRGTNQDAPMWSGGMQPGAVMDENSSACLLLPISSCSFCDSYPVAGLGISARELRS